MGPIDPFSVVCRWSWWAKISAHSAESGLFPNQSKYEEWYYLSFHKNREEPVNIVNEG